jgi:hypothetical protein
MNASKIFASGSRPGGDWNNMTARQQAAWNAGDRATRAGISKRFGAASRAGGVTAARRSRRVV